MSKQQHESDILARNIADAGARPAIPADISAGVRAAVAQEWQRRALQRTRSRRMQRSVAVAAGVLLVLGIIAAVRWQSAADTAVPAGIFLASRGAVDIRSREDTHPAVGGSSLYVGTRIRTGTDARALLAVANLSVRIGASSDASLDAVDSITLHSGQIYLDFSARGAHVSQLKLRTPFGAIEHLGTQFQAQILGNQLRVSVREGEIKITTALGAQVFHAREAAVIDSAGRTARHAVEPFGEQWDWATELAPDFPIEGRSLGEFLEWFARESGHEVVVDPSSSTEAATTRMSGSIAGLAPMDALHAVLASTRFEYRLQPDGRLQVSKREPPHDTLPRDGTPSSAASLSHRT